MKSKDLYKLKYKDGDGPAKIYRDLCEVVQNEQLIYE
jgi:hypothetical protein